MSLTLENELMELCRQQRALLERNSIPKWAQSIVIAELLENGDKANPEGREGHSFLDVYLATRNRVRVAVFGGSLLNRGTFYGEAYYKLNRQLAHLFARMPNLIPETRPGWSKVHGRGPGLAMKGSAFCLQEERQQVENCVSLSIGVTSALSNEVPHCFCDHDVIVRMQRNIFTREMIVMALAEHGAIAYIGSKGTDVETSLTDLVGYTAFGGLSDAYGRKVTIDLPVRPLVFVDHPRRDPGKGWCYDEILKLRATQILEFGLIKPDREMPEPLRVEVTSPDAAEKIVEMIRQPLVQSGAIPKSWQTAA